MKLKVTVIFAVLIICIGLVTGTCILQSAETEELDLAELNDLAYICSEGWHKIVQGDTGWLPVSIYEYAVFDNTGGRLYASKAGVADTIEAGRKNKDVIISLNADDAVVGELLIKNEDTQHFTKIKSRLFGFVAAESAMFALLFVCYSLYLRHTFFIPFEKLEKFAARIAEGNLDMPLTMDKKKVFGVFTESFDIMREELKRAREMERLAQQSKKELVAELSHDIKTPIASIKAVSEVMAVQAAGEKERSQLSVIEKKANQIDALISNLFHATLEELQELSVNTHETSSLVISDLLLSADYQGQARVGEIPQCLVYMDELRMQQVFDNLFANSYKYANTNIEVTAEVYGEFLCIYCRDFGPGVSQEELNLLKNKYYRGKLADGKNGAGLGLYISNYLMEQMGGSLDCRNLNNGFEVILCLKI